MLRVIPQGTDGVLQRPRLKNRPVVVIVQEMTKHPLTDQGIEKFQADYKAVFGE